MPYSVRKNSKGRIVVTNPKGKDWKTTYSSPDAAEKAIAYIEGRFGAQTDRATPSSPIEAPMTATASEEGYTPPEGERGTKTLIRLRTLQDEEAF